MASSTVGPTGGAASVPPSGTPAHAPTGTPRKKANHSSRLYLWVLIAAVLGILVGLIWPDLGLSLKWLSTLFVNLVKMMIAPIIFCTIVIGIGSVRKAASVGKVGGLALGYFIVMSTFALAIGLVVGNIIHPGDGLALTDKIQQTGAAQVPKTADNTVDFVLGIIPLTMVSSLTAGSVLQALLIALLVGFALQRMGAKGAPILRGIEHLEGLVFKVMAMVMWVAPIGAFGGLAALVGAGGWSALWQIVRLMFGFYVTCIIFVFGVLGLVLWLVARVNVWSLLKYYAKEFLIILATSSSESALPRSIAKTEHLGIDRSTVGISIPTGYSFNLDGTAIYLTMASLFVADAMGKPMSIGEQIGLLLFMIIASKGAAGVSGAGLATLAGGLSSHRPDLVPGVGFVVGIDRFMSEARALTNFAGNMIAAVVVGTWTRTIDRERMQAVLSGQLPFDEADDAGDAEHVEDGHGEVVHP